MTLEPYVTTTAGGGDDSGSAASRTERMFHDLLESAPDAMVVTDSSGVIQLVNAETERLFGYRRDELIGQPVEVFIPERFRSRHPAHRAAFTANSRVRAMGVGLELRGRRNDASEFPVEVSLRPLEAQGSLIAVAIRDVTERKAAERAMQEAAIIASSDDAIIAKTLGGIITHWNQGAERIYGYTADEVIGRHVSILLPPGHFDEMPDAIERIEKGEPVAPPVDTQRVRKDGTLVDVSLRISAIRDSEGAIIGASTVARDITERKLAEAALAERTADLARSNAELEQFAYVASHDLQEPLRHISAFVQKLADRYGDVVDERGQRYIGYVVDGAKRMQALIEALLELSRVGRAELQLRAVDLDDVVSAATRAVSAQGVRVGAVITATPMPSICGDPDLMYRLFVNLLSNAIKFARPDQPARVEISARVDDDGVCEIHVRDNGIGIDPEYRVRAFDIFERLHGSDYPGTGIGLSVARRIVEAHSGTIALDESPAGGTDVVLTFATAPGSASIED